MPKRPRLPPAPARTDKPPGHQSPGAPPLDIDAEEVRALARLGHTAAQIADFYQCDSASIYRRVSSVELNKLRQERPRKLKEAVFARAMGGKYEEKQLDGTVVVKFLKSSEKMMELALKYLVGAPAQQIEFNPSPEAPMHVSHTVDKESLKVALAELNEEF